ncbi:MAG: C40 family peptidase [Armatimonadetes bacterium]|nr:C40 family peptidase [Armatimonadota bacterium]
MLRTTTRITALLSAAACAASGYAATAKVLGHLGQTVETAIIRSKPSTKGGIYHRAKAFEYIIIKDVKQSGWLGVVMSDMRTGYIKADLVARLPYEVTTQTAEQPRSTGSGRDLGTPASRSEIANYALNFVGTPYKWGGNDINRGIDCSGFVKVLYGKIGVDLPRTAAEQATVGTKIERLEDLQAGDRLYFWDRKRGKIGHTGIYMGNGYFVHSSSNHRGVATDVLSEKWRKMLVAARR